jgi:hypothetical protein
LGCPLPRLSACWPEGCGDPREWGVSGVVKSLVNIDLLFETRRFYNWPSVHISSMIQISSRKASKGLQARLDHSTIHHRQGDRLCERNL